MIQPTKRLWRSSEETLTDLGWTEADIDAFVADWPHATSGDLDVLVHLADAAHAYRTSPQQARAWMATLFQTWNGSVGPTLQAIKWVQDTDPSHSVWDIVGVYVEAAHGDHEIAQNGFLAGFSAPELDAGLAAGTCHLAALQALAGLRAGR